MSLLRMLARKPIVISRAVMLQHTLFSLPFAAAGVLMETSGRPAASDVVWIILAITGARNGANALNRVIDLAYDKRNPRTASRELSAGALKVVEMSVFAVLCLCLLVVSAFMLNPLCAALLPVAGLFIIGYSYTKRFTWLCHFVLGLTAAMAPMGALLAVAGRFEFRFFPLAGAVALWVAGFDIIYGSQDIEFDRNEGLHSIPARFGLDSALWIARACHVLSWLLFVLWAVVYDAGAWCHAGIAICGALMILQHLLMASKKMDHVDFAAYHVNEAIGIVFFVFSVLEVYL